MTYASLLPSLLLLGLSVALDRRARRSPGATGRESPWRALAVASFSLAALAEYAAKVALWTMALAVARPRQAADPSANLSPADRGEG